MKYIKVMFGDEGANYKYKINEVNIAHQWNPTADKGRDFGGFNYTTEDCILRWLHRGDTLYDVAIPEDAEVIKLEGATTIYRSNKIIVSNPQKISDDMALKFYKMSKIPESSYFKSLGVVSLMNYRNTAFQILRDKVNRDNIDIVLDEWNDFINKYDRKERNELVSEIEDALFEIKSDLLISISVDKDPYIKQITRDKIINLTGQSGSGKSTYAKEKFNSDDYIVIDTDDVMSKPDSGRYKEATKINREIGNMLRMKYNDSLSLENDFDLIYKEILDYCKDIDKTIVIDCAQFHCIKNIENLRGKIIVIRTCIDNCYNRVLNRYKQIMKNDYDEEKFKKYASRKLGIYNWYKGSNDFLKKIDGIKKI